MAKPGAVEVVFSVTGLTGDGVTHSTFLYEADAVKAPRPWKRGRPKGSVNKRKRGRVDPSAPDFTFINVTKSAKDLDSASRTLIRRHARLHPTHYHASSRPSTGTETEDSSDESNEADVELFDARTGLTHPNEITSVDPFGVAPIRLAPYMCDLLRYFESASWKSVYSLENLADWNPVREYWLPIAFRDAALLHSLIGCADIFKTGHRTVTDSHRGLLHLNTSISLINQRLSRDSDDERLTPGLVAVLSGIAMLERGAGRYENWRIHMQGVRKLIDVSGGLASLHDKPLVLHKLYRADLCGSLDLVESPFLHRPLPTLFDSVHTTQFRSPGLNAIDHLINPSQVLRNCVHQLEKAMKFWNYLSSQHQSPTYLSDERQEYDNWDRVINRVRGMDTGTNMSENTDMEPTMRRPTAGDAARTRFLITQVQYALASTDIASPSESSGEFHTKLHKLYRLTLIMYAMSLLNERPASRIAELGLTEKVWSLLEDLMPLLNSSQSPSMDLGNSQESHGVNESLLVDFCLWTMFLAIMMTSNASKCGVSIHTRASFVPEFSRMVSIGERGASTCTLEELQRQLSRYLWVPSIHEPALVTLYDEMKRWD